MGFLSELQASLPGIDALRENVEAAITWGPWEYNRAFIQGAVIDGSAADAGGDPTTLLRPGLMMAQVRAASGTDPLKWKQWDPTATDGTQDFGGILLWDASMVMLGSARDRWFGYILTGGLVKSSSIIIPGAASAGLAGAATEYYCRGVLNGRYLLDDYPHLHAGSPILGGWKNIVTKAADYTVVAADNGTLFHTTGAAGAVTFTLPAVATCKGLRFGFFNVADQNMTVASAAAGGLITFNNAAASSVAYSTAGNKIGAYTEVIGLSATKWMVFHLCKHTLTVA